MPNPHRSLVPLAAAVALVVAGCSVGPDYHSPDSGAPASFGATTRPASTQPFAATQPAKPVDLARWWESFNDPMLDRLIIEGVQENLDVRLAQARVREAREQLRYNAANLLPTLDASGSYSRIRSSQGSNTGVSGVGTTSNNGNTGNAGGNGNAGNTGGNNNTGNTGAGNGGGSAITSFGSGGSERDLFTAGFDAGWEIDVFGGTRRAIESAEYSLDATVDARRNALVTLLSEVARNYVQLRGYQYQLGIANRNIASQEDSLKLQQQKLQAGIATALTVAQAEALLASTQAQVPTLEAEVRTSIHALSVLLDREPAALVEELTPQTPLPVGPPNVPVGLPAELVRRRPDVRQAERTLAASTASIGVATADLYPKFSIAGSLGVTSNKLTNLPNNSAVYYSVGPSVSWRVFDWGQIRANIAISTALQEQSFIQYRQTVLNALEEVENALVNYDREQSRRQRLQQAVDANRRSVDLARQLNDAGVVDFLNVLTAQQSLFQSEDQLAQSDTLVSSNLVALYKALGGGWEPSEVMVPQPADAETTNATRAQEIAPPMRHDAVVQ